MIEMNLHEDLWNTVAISEDEEYINSECLASVLRILLDPIRIKIEESAQII